jgi:four helix bundle protein
VHYRQTAIWQKSFELAREACLVAARLPPRERFTMRPQITRAAISVASNVAEGWARESRLEKARFLSIAQGSLAELDTQLLLCSSIGWIKDSSLHRFRALEQEVGRMLTALRRHFRSLPPPAIHPRPSSSS